MKRLIVCCDGTWYSADKGLDNIPSNVAQISRMIAPYGKDTETGKRVEQIVYYQTGVGSGPMGKIDSAWQGATGAGLEENVTTAYHYLANNYEKGDEIFLFGFSRGAYTARALAGMVTEMGLLWPQKLRHFPDLYNLYRKRRVNDGGKDVHSHVHPMNDASCSDARKELLTDRYTGKFWRPAEEMQSDLDEKLWNKIKEFHPDNAENKVNRSEISHLVRIKVIGVWDTVGSRGLPKSLLSSLTGYNEKYGFHDTALNRKIDHAFHALSLDEHRGAFEPTLWYLDYSSKDYGADTDLKQCWFPGFHADIGGGTTTGMEHTSKIDQITLAWMCDLVDGLLDFDEDACHELLHLKKSRTSQVLTERKKWAEGDTNDSSILYNLPIAGGYVARTPGLYHKVPENEECAKATNETVHPSVHYRHDKKGYDPPALKQHPGWFNGKNPVWEFRELKDGNGAQWVRPEVPEKKGMIWGTVNGKKEVKLDEWWIREIQEPHRLNLEWNLLPPEVKDMLKSRNEHRPCSLVSSEEQPPIYCRNVY
ncbi:uncharacterized protein LTHEOB_650 [Lasiodiplodia theobromae]|uniref:uncharacterized protein n=1 Tax=Lasiodiplodia theobromae TaxID=45133 RepID=UPI0015C3298F|nr:uncharacterized protein LTHEOB_650 [Lasiodiplodia theobromae]KAF4540708.1 hypothetical protein LTHEOB_650 [Lasiodiplodia theobromae]